MLFRTLATAMLLTAPAIAQDAQDKPQDPPKRVRSVVLYGDEQCPKAQDPDEIVVCAKEGESPYRIPKQFRNPPKEDAASQSWANRAETMKEVNSAGLPGSCTPVGIAAQTGCTAQELQKWARERADQKRKASRVP